jgi:hypothetical protein
MSTIPTSRRSALGFSAAAIVSGITTPALAGAGGPDPDEELIRNCDRLAAIRIEELALYSIPDGEEDDEYEDTLESLNEKWHQVASLIYASVPPQTLEGVRALARAAITGAERAPDGSTEFVDIAQWMSIRAMEFLAGREMA